MKYINEYRETSDGFKHVKEWHLNRWYEKTLYVLGWVLTIWWILVFVTSFIVSYSGAS